MPIFATVVVWPAKNGKAPHTPHPIAPKKNNIGQDECARKWPAYDKDPK